MKKNEKSIVYSSVNNPINWNQSKSSKSCKSCRSCTKDACLECFDEQQSEYVIFANAAASEVEARKDFIKDIDVYG